jgi:hypothetical protein
MATLAETAMADTFPTCRAAAAACYTLKPVPWLFCAVGAGCEFGAILWISGKATPCGRFLAANHKMLEGDLSQNAASGKPTAFVSTNESALAKSG